MKKRGYHAQRRVRESYRSDETHEYIDTYHDNFHNRLFILLFLPHFLQNTGSPSVYGEISSRGEKEEKKLNATDGFEIESFDKVQRLNYI